MRWTLACALVACCCAPARDAQPANDGGSSAGAESPVIVGGASGAGGRGGSAGSSTAAGSGRAVVGGASQGGAAGADATGELRTGPFKMLIFSWTTGFHHASIAAAQQMAAEIGASNPIAPFTIDIANAQPPDPTGACLDDGENDPTGKQLPIPGCVATVSMFTEENLKNYEIVFFANPTGNDFSESKDIGTAAMAAFEKYMNDGGAYIGVHSATDFEKGATAWAFYYEMLGGLLDGHDFSGLADVVVQDGSLNHPVVRGLPTTDSVTDEWYLMGRTPEGRTGISVLAKLSTDQRPVVWTHEYDGGGRMVYTIRGHSIASYSEPWLRQLFLQGVMWATHRIK